MPKLTPVVLAVFLLEFLYSCRSYRYIYSPPPANNPFFREKGESKLSVLYSGGDRDYSDKNFDNRKQTENIGTDIQAGYAITNHVAVTGSYYFRHEKDLYDGNYSDGVFNTSIVDYKRKLTDFGIGYFAVSDSKKKTTWSVYAGIGFGKFRLNDQGLDDTLAAYSRFYEAHIRKGYLQPGLNFWIGNALSLGLSARCSFIYYYDNTTSYNSQEQRYFFFDQINNKMLVNLEPTLSLEFTIPSMRWLKADAGITFVSKWPDGYPSSRNVNVSAGLTFDLSRLKRKK